jgi:hypothetical protein
MGNIVIATPVLSDAATITAGNESPAGPAANLQKMQPTDMWESASGTSYIEADLGAVSSFNLVAMLFTNAVSTDSWRVRTADTQGNLTAAPTYDSGVVTLTDIGPDGHAFDWQSGGMSNRWVRVDFTTAANPFQAGRLYISDAYQPSINYDYNGQDGYDDDSLLDATDGGSLIPNQGTNRAILGINTNIADETERHNVREISRLRGSSKDVLVITNPDATINVSDHIYYGLLQRRRFAVQTQFNLHKHAYQLTAL